ncbi:MAG TPA: hypothetical protein VKF82_11310 [Candidatus Eremiobacteraceae bacterium]|nr:hypothetical protein [Candidatus Eremiobacteraceae bacterium]
MIFWLSAGIGALLWLIGVLVRRYGDAEVGGAIAWIGGICAAVGFVSGLSLLSGGLSVLGLLAVICAGFATLGPTDQRVGFWLVAIGFALEGVNQLPGQGAEWLTTIAVIACALGLAALLNTWLRSAMRSSSTTETG